jgi:putative intracellular protease/amidase
MIDFLQNKESLMDRISNITSEKNCYLYVLDDLADWEIAFLTAELQSQRYTSQCVSIKFHFIAETLEPIRTMGGALIEPEQEVSQIKFIKGDLLILPGSEKWAQLTDNSLLARLEEINEKGVVIAAICGATLALARSGLLNEREHTSNDPDYLQMLCPEYRGRSYYSSKRVVVNDNIISASGLAPLEFSYEVIKKNGLMDKETGELWYQLYHRRDPKYFMPLLDSMK